MSRKSNKSKNLPTPTKTDSGRRETIQETRHHEQQALDSGDLKRAIECIPDGTLAPGVKRQLLDQIDGNSSSTHFRIERRQEMQGFPIPMPHTLADYEKIDKDIVPRFLKAWQSEETTRQRLEDVKLQAQIHVEMKKHTERMRGMFFGFLIGLAGMFLSGWMVYLGHPTQATIFGSGTIVALVTVFVTRKRPAIKGKSTGEKPIEDQQGFE